MKQTRFKDSILYNEIIDDDRLFDKVIADEPFYEGNDYDWSGTFRFVTEGGTNWVEISKDGSDRVDYYEVQGWSQSFAKYVKNDEDFYFEDSLAVFVEAERSDKTVSKDLQAGYITEFWVTLNVGGFRGSAVPRASGCQWITIKLTNEDRDFLFDRIDNYIENWLDWSEEELDTVWLSPYCFTDDTWEWYQRRERGEI